ESSPRTRRASHATSSRGDLVAKAGVGDAAFRGDVSGEAFSSAITRFSRSLSRFSTLWSCCWPYTVAQTARITLDARSGDFMRACVMSNYDWTNLRKRHEDFFASSVLQCCYSRLSLMERLPSPASARRQPVLNYSPTP